MLVQVLLVHLVVPAIHVYMDVSPVLVLVETFKATTVYLTIPEEPAAAAKGVHQEDIITTVQVV